MQLADMITAVNRLVDDVVSQSDALQWLNAGKDRLAQEANAVFPDMDGVNITTYPFPAKFHYAVVLYAAVKYLEQSVMLDQAAELMKQFQEQMTLFVERYDIPPAYRDDNLHQQFVATSGQQAFIITANSYDPDTAVLKVYRNGRLTTDWQIPLDTADNPSQIVTTLATSNDPNAFIFNPTTPIASGDTVTAEWELHEDYNQPPYQWWSF